MQFYSSQSDTELPKPVIQCNTNFEKFDGKCYQEYWKSYKRQRRHTDIKIFAMHADSMDMNLFIEHTRSHTITKNSSGNSLLKL